ncbi:MAPEG family protein [Mesorhizobium sp. M1403]|uniref:MAPEG family protein n=1 Tax=Mesorhizobium sp. M1403 TaxID=2957097 RepID=UPI003336A974
MLRLCGFIAAFILTSFTTFDAVSALETLPVFVAGVFLVHALGRESCLSEWGASLYFSVRLVYLPPYAAGLPLVRSLVWNVAFVGIVLLLLASLWPEL